MFRSFLLTEIPDVRTPIQGVLGNAGSSVGGTAGIPDLRLRSLSRNSDQERENFAHQCFPSIAGPAFLLGVSLARSPVAEAAILYDVHILRTFKTVPEPE